MPVFPGFSGSLTSDAAAEITELNRIDGEILFWGVSATAIGTP
jgi:hypothetical protein